MPVKIQPPSHDILYNEYMNKNMTAHQLSNIFGVSVTTIRRWLKYYNINKPQELYELSAKNAIFDKYEGKYFSQTKKWLQKYEETSLIKYGTKYYTQTDEYRKRRKNTNLEKYGVEHPNMLKETIDKIKKSTEKNLGVSNILQVGKKYLDIYTDKEELKKFILEQDDKTTENISKKLEITQTTLNRYIKKFNLRKYVLNYHSKYELRIQNILHEYGFASYSDRKELNGDEIDVYVPKIKSGIEFNGSYWHSSEQKPITYHLDKVLKAYKKEIFLFNIFDYEFNKIEDLIKMFLNQCGYYDSYSIPNNVSYRLTNDFISFDIKDWTKNVKNDMINILSNYDTLYYELDLSKYSILFFESLGFELIKIIEPSYKIINYHTSEIANNIEVYDKNVYSRVYDCGKAIMKYNKEKK